VVVVEVVDGKNGLRAQKTQQLEVKVVVVEEEEFIVSFLRRINKL